MIIPIKCFTCGNVLADKYLYYVKEVRKMKIKQGIDMEEVVYLDNNKIKKTPEGIILDKLNLTKMCCRRHMLTHVDIE
jgi:DNA-directed RNA polymerases I, II, and III subunit RPABC5|tara:strand:- start:3191 stop:3424 length:234 start_codon:yes stop_codon:yes gene_type:complete